MIVTANLGADNERYERQGRQDERSWSPHQSHNDKSYERKREMYTLNLRARLVSMSVAHER